MLATLLLVLSWDSSIIINFCFQDFKKETGLQYTLYCDPEREIYSALNLGTDYTPVDLGSKWSYTLCCDPEREIYSPLNLGTDYTPVDLGSKWSYTLCCDPEREIYSPLNLGTDYTPVDLGSKWSYTLCCDPREGNILGIKPRHRLHPHWSRQ